MIINNELEYQHAFQQLEKLVAEKFEGNADKESQFIALTTAIEQYENDTLKLFPIHSTKDAVGFLTSLMKHKKLKINDLAHILHISENDLFAIMHYQKPFTFEHAERVKKALDIEATFILQAA
jgi:antitoxin component HigA of HigAB toxin-antitoxin module